MENDTVIKTRAMGLTNNSTVFQAEMQAVRLACSIIKEDVIPEGSDIVLMIDSQAGIKVLENVDTKSNLVKQTKTALNELGEFYNISIHWIKTHVGNKGNENADQAAKSGCNLPEKFEILNGQEYIKSLIKEEMEKEWNIRWQTAPDCRQAFQFYKFMDPTKAKKIYKLNRYDLGILMRYTTGHAHLRRHNKIAGTIQPPSFGPENKYQMENPEDSCTTEKDAEIRCRLCNIKGREETPFHLFTECLAAWYSRWEIFGNYTFENEESVPWDPKQLVRFFKKFDLENKPN